MDEMATYRELVILSSKGAVVAGHLASRLADWLLSQNRGSSAKAYILGRLGVILVTIGYDLQNNDLVEQKVSQNRIHKFLRRLEAICTVGPTAVCAWKTLMFNKVAKPT